MAQTCWLTSVVFCCTVGDIESAVSAAAAYLLLRPDDETMVSNMEFYETLHGINKYTIKPRMDVQDYKDRQDLEKDMLEFAKNEFWGEEDEEVKGKDKEGEGEGKEVIQEGEEQEEEITGKGEVTQEGQEQQQGTNEKVDEKEEAIKGRDKEDSTAKDELFTEEEPSGKYGGYSDGFSNRGYIDAWSCSRPNAMMYNMYWVITVTDLCN